jgi:hypothetical protein
MFYERMQELSVPRWVCNTEVNDTLFPHVQTESIMLEDVRGLWLNVRLEQALPMTLSQIRDVVH